MPQITLLFGTLLFLLGSIAFFATGGTHYTALIPVPFGVTLLVLGGLGTRPHLKKHAMHLAVIIAVLGAVGAGSRLRNIHLCLPGIQGPCSSAKIASFLMTFICACYTILAVFSFMKARTGKKMV